MASVNWQKANVQMVGAMIKHNGKKERVENNHSNKDIDKSKSHLNIYIGADDWSAMADKVKKRVEEVDKEHPPLRDTGKGRVTCFLLETPVPQEIAEQGKAEEFLRKAHKVLEDFFGAENVGGTVGHFDEQHYYTDKDGKERLSLIHGHSPIAAYVEWTEDIKKNVKQPNGRYKQVKTGETRERCGINGKHCESKARLTALNKAMEEMCRREYGISYNTAETPEHKSVERLKEETALRETADGLRKDIRELSEKKGECLDNYLNAIPPLKQEPYPAKPDIPSGYDWSKRPEVTSSGVVGVVQEHKQRDWEKQRETSIRKRDEKHEKACGEVDKRNAKARQEWEDKYLTADNLRKAEREITPALSSARAAKQEAEKDRAKAAAERRKAEQERKQAEAERKKQAESFQNELQQAVQREVDRLFGGVPKDREERLEQFCEGITFSDGETALEKFEQQEEDRKQTLKRGRGIGR